MDRGGGFNYDDLYFEMVQRHNDGAIFIEIGVYRGGSLQFMSEIVKQSGKNIKLYGVDNFSECYHVNGNKITTYDDCVAALSPYPDTSLIVGDSVDIAKQFDDGYFDFIFIDANHTYPYVKMDLESWFPKLKSTGYIAGHDYCEPFAGVKQAVDEFFPHERIQLKGSCWFVPPLKYMK